MAANGFAFASTTKLRGTTAMAHVHQQPATTSSDLRQTVAIMSRLASNLEKQLR